MYLKPYLIIGAGVGLLFFLIVTFFGETVADWGRDQQYESDIRSQRVLSTLVYDPFIFVFDPENQPFGAIIAGVAWPAVLIWILLVILSLMIIAGVDVSSNITEVTFLDPFG